MMYRVAGNAFFWLTKNALTIFKSKIAGEIFRQRRRERAEDRFFSGKLTPISRLDSGVILLLPIHQMLDDDNN